jgi:hypothetical protein
VLSPACAVLRLHVRQQPSSACCCLAGVAARCAQCWCWCCSHHPLCCALHLSFPDAREHCCCWQGKTVLVAEQQGLVLRVLFHEPVPAGAAACCG